MINLSSTRHVLDECLRDIDTLDGQALDESSALTDQSKGDARRERARLSQDLQQLATRLDLAAALVRNEYWYARSGKDPLHPRRSD